MFLVKISADQSKVVLIMQGSGALSFLNPFNSNTERREM